MCVCVWVCARVLACYLCTFQFMHVSLTASMWMSGYFSAHILLLVFLISKSGPWSSLCRDGRFPLCKCHQSPLPVSPLSAPCCPLWHLWDRPCPFSDKEPWWLHTQTHRHTHKHTHSLTHTYRYLMENRNTEETPTKISRGRKIHITFRDHPFYKMYHIDFYGYALYMSYYLIIHRIKECDVFKLL